MLRANCSVIVRSRPPLPSSTTVPVVPPPVMPESSRMVTVPLSVPQNTTSEPSFLMPAARSSGASGAPAQRALPMPPMTNGKPVLPEHSSVKSTARTGAVFEIGERDRHGVVDEAVDTQAVLGGVDRRKLVVLDREEVVARRTERVERLPLQEVPDDVLRGRRHVDRLVLPGEHVPGRADVPSVVLREVVRRADLGRERVRRPGNLEDGQSRHHGAATLQQVRRDRSAFSMRIAPFNVNDDYPLDPERPG